MNTDELKQYLAENSQVENRFMEKALDYLNQKNLDRAPARRYNETMVQRQADKLYDELLENVNSKIASQNRGPQTKESWIKIMAANNLLEGLEDSMSDLSFEAED